MEDLRLPKWHHSRNLKATCFFLMSLRAAMSSGASEGTLVTTPVPEGNIDKENCRKMYLRT